MIIENMPNAKQIKDLLLFGAVFVGDELGNIWYKIDPVNLLIYGSDRYGKSIFLTEDNRLGYYNEE